MPRLYLLGGEVVSKRSAFKVNQEAFQRAGAPLSVLVFPWAKASFDRQYVKRKMLSDYFLSLGASKVEFIEFSSSKDVIRGKMASSNLIYLTGGLVTALIERLNVSGVDDLLRDYHGVVVGRSAGALALCKKSVITNRRSKRLRIVSGLGLADLTLKTHYRIINDSKLELLSRGRKIYAVPSRSALVYQYGVCSVIGEAFLFDNGKKRVLAPFNGC
jgi:dipeptidase E